MDLPPVRRLASLSTASVVAALAAWQVASARSWIDPVMLPSPGEVLRSGAELLVTGYRQVPLWQHVATSVGRALAAFVAAIGLGVPLGLLMGRSRIAAAVLDPFVQFLRPLPKIALIPLVVVWLGIGEASKFFLIFISSFLSVVVGAAAAAASVNRQRLRAARSLGAKEHQLFRRVILPETLPQLFTTIRLSIGIGWTSLIAAEMVAASSGLGWMVVNAGSYLRTDVVLLGIFLLGAVGWLLDWAVVRAQRTWIPWAGMES